MDNTDYDSRYMMVESVLREAQRFMKEKGVKFQYMINGTLGGKTFYGTFNANAIEPGADIFEAFKIDDSN